MEVVSFSSRPLSARERTPVPIEKEDGWAPKPLWMFWRREKFLAPPHRDSNTGRSSSLVAIPYRSAADTLVTTWAVGRSWKQNSIQISSESHKQEVGEKYLARMTQCTLSKGSPECTTTQAHLPFKTSLDFHLLTSTKWAGQQYYTKATHFFFLWGDPAADATDAPQP
jgi:hypothetical protein